jgi:hypothetical protein
MTEVRCRGSPSTRRSVGPCCGARLASGGHPRVNQWPPETGCATVAWIAIRDSRDPYGPVLAFDPKDWQRFADRVKAGA